MNLTVGNEGPSPPSFKAQSLSWPAFTGRRWIKVGKEEVTRVKITWGQLDDSWVVSECVKELTYVFLAYEQELD